MRRLALPVLVVALVASVAGQSRRPEIDPIAEIADALGGRDRILALRSLTVEGYGELAYQNGGGNITGSPDAPQKWIKLNDYARVVDLRNWRSRVRQTQVNDFVFAAARQMRGASSTQAVDGEIAFNLGADGTATRAGGAAARTRRMEMYAHPIAIVRAALDSRSTVRQPNPSDRIPTNGRQFEVTTPTGDTLTLAVGQDRRPLWVSWMGSDGVLGDVTYRAHFTGYQRVNGILMPTGINTTIDFRNLVWQKLYVDRHALDEAVGDLSAPPALRTAAAPGPPPRPTIEVTEVAKGIWFLRGAGNSTLFEFDDHLTLFEAYGNEASALAVIERARALVPGKPLTQVIVSHHHFDHTGGIRAAVSEGLTVVTARGNEGILNEVIRRRATLAPDALERKRQPLKTLLVDDHLPMKDASMAIDVYRVVANSHMADGLMVHVPRERLLVQGDLFDVNWEIYWWGSSYADNVRYRNLQVDRDLPVHGRILPFAEVQQHIATQIKAAQALCASVQTAGLTMRGCPVKTTVDR